MRDQSRFSHSTRGVLAVAIFIQSTDSGAHTGIIHHSDGSLHSLDLRWNNDLGSKILTRDRPCVTPSLEPEETINVLSLCRLIHSRMKDPDPLKQLRIPYAIRYGGSRFHPSNADIDLGDGYGLTCSTFVLCVFDSAFVPLIDLKDWQKRPDDAARINQYLNWLETGVGGYPPASAEHIARFKVDIQRKDCLRVRPEEVAAAGLFNDTVSFQDVVPAGEWILSQLQPAHEAN